MVGFEPPPEHLTVIQLNGIDHLVLVTERIAVLYDVIVVKTHQISGTQTVGIAIPKKTQAQPKAILAQEINHTDSSSSKNHVYVGVLPQAHLLSKNHLKLQHTWGIGR